MSERPPFFSARDIRGAQHFFARGPLPVRLDPIDGGGWLFSCDTIGFAAAGSTLGDSCRSFRSVLREVFAIPESERMLRVAPAARAELLEALVRFELDTEPPSGRRDS